MQCNGPMYIKISMSVGYLRLIIRSAGYAGWKIGLDLIFFSLSLNLFIYFMVTLVCLADNFCSDMKVEHRYMVGLEMAASSLL